MQELFSMLIPFNELWAKHKIQTTGVLHLGANAGQEAPAYDAQGVKRVIWVEALSSVFKQLVKNIKPYPGHLALCACLGDIDGKKVSFNTTSNDCQSSSFLEFGTHATEHPTVKVTGTIPMVTVRVDTLLNRHEIKIGPGWFLNIDLQGAELMALKGMGDLIHCFDYAYIEVNTRPLYVGCPMVEEIDAHLGRLGFVGREVKMTGSGWGDKFYQRTPVR